MILMITRLSSRAERGILFAELEPFPGKIPRSARDDSKVGQMADTPRRNLPYSWIDGHSGRPEYPQEMMHVQPTITDPDRLL
jgi:hypothetical protein